MTTLSQMTMCALFAVGFASAGCISPAADTDEARKETAGVRQGLTVFTESLAEGLNGMYVEKDSVVYFETMKDEDGPGWSMRWVDVDGRGILSDFNGAHGGANDKWLDPEPTQEIVMNRLKILDVVIRASEALAAQPVKSEVADLKKGVVALAANIPPAAERIRRVDDETPPPVATGTPPTATGEVPYYNTGWYKQRFAVVDSGLVGAHQCTRWENYYLDSNGYYYYYNWINNRNGHGDTPTCDKYNCGWVWTAKHGYKSPSQTGEQFGSAWACSTPFNLWPGATGKHNCRSDSKRQARYVMANIICSSTAGFCNISQGLLMGADCSTNTSCSN